jgi:hypothetical protein
MIPALRRSFNANWTEQKYAEFGRLLRERVGVPIEFPVSETPCFLPHSLMTDLAAAGIELTRQALSGEAAGAAARVVPERFHGPHQGDVPVFTQVDFGLVRNARGTIEPKLVELQAFASLYAFQLALADSYAAAFHLDVGGGTEGPPLQTHLDGLTRDRYLDLARRAIVGDHDPAEVVLMEIAPERQKTRPDFVMTEKLWGVRAIDVDEVVVEGRHLLYRRDGRLTRIRRVYNRVIPDELDQKQIVLPFDYRDDLDVEWAGHPAWFFRVSKFSIPWLRHPSVPRTWFLSDLPAQAFSQSGADSLPLARDQLLLKPLFSFAGGGIVFAPTGDELRAIPPPDRGNYILQERLSFEPLIDTPHGATQVEIRMMYLWTDRLRPVLPLLRMGRGKMMGVDHNKGLRWVGASAAFIA